MEENAINKCSKRVLNGFAIVSMSIRYRPLQPKDVRKCVELVAAHPILGPRYGRVIEQLPRAILHRLGGDCIAAIAFEEFQKNSTRFLGACLAAFVSDDFLCKVKTVLNFWVGPELVKAISSGNSPLLSDKEVRDANSTGGLNLILWHNKLYPVDLRRAESGTACMTCLHETYRGFFLKELLGQADSLEQFHGMQNCGGRYFWTAEGCFGGFPQVDAHHFSDEPRNAGITRELAISELASWVGSLFVY